MHRTLLHKALTILLALAAAAPLFSSAAAGQSSQGGTFLPLGWDARGEGLAGAATILRGIRNSNDLQFEFQMALTNRAVAGTETVFIMPGSEYAFTSSSLIKQIARMGGDVSALVPPEVLPYITKRV